MQTQGNSTLLKVLAVFALAGPLQAQESLPIRSILLFKNGMAQVVRSGQISEPLRISFHKDDMSDILKSLAAWNPDTNSLYPTSYTAATPVEEILGRFPFDLREGGDMGLLLGQFIGEAVDLTVSGKPVSGVLLGVKEVQRASLDSEAARDFRITLLSPEDRVRTFWLDELQDVHLKKADLNLKLRSYLSTLASGGRRETAQVTVHPVPEGGNIQMAYVQQFPLWKTSHRLDIGETSRIQAWAQIDNPTGEAWENIELVLVSGFPTSFRMNLYAPTFSRRQQIALPETGVEAPLQFQDAVSQLEGSAQLSGRVSDATGAVIPGATVTLEHQSSGRTFQGVTNDSGGFQFAGLPAGAYNVTVELAGFRTTRQLLTLEAGGRTRFNPVLQPGTVSEAVTVQSQPEFRLREESAGQTLLRSRAVAFPEAETYPAEDYFQYRIPFRVSLADGQSALLPLLSRDIQAETLSVFRAEDGRRPHLAVRLVNDTGVPLDAGAVTVYQQGQYAGEGIVGYVGRDADAFVDYGVDYNLGVDWNNKRRPEETSRVTFASGVATFHREQTRTTTYSFENKADQAKTVLLEHRRNKSVLSTSPEPDETTSDYYRYRVSLEPGQGRRLEVRELVNLTQRVGLGGLDLSQLQLQLRGRRLPAGIMSELERIFETRRQLADLRRQKRTVEENIMAITSDQTRVRENLQALRGSDEEKELRQRYIEKLRQQEDQLVELRRTEEDLSRQIEDHERRLAEQIQALKWNGSTV